MDSNDKKKKFPGYPPYPGSEDIFKRGKREARTPEEGEEEDLEMGLDVPGSDLDDDQEMIGNEDEENNYYSLGGDNHDDEDNPDLVDDED
ncbi:hypothetical protein GCM10023091_04890 [Ravibacter arvi]|uniref:Uncharacterized protein n=1 Tax=Ravibacter arvi TaxID=2051041 RepID=A0ABP8LQE7_9BACT